MTARVLDNHNRWRSKTVAFRMSPEEAEQLDAFVQMSGLSKQDYMIQRVLQREIVVIGNPRVYKGLKKQMEEIAQELQRISDVSGVDDEMLEKIDQIKTILVGLQELSK